VDSGADRPDPKQVRGLARSAPRSSYPGARSEPQARSEAGREPNNREDKKIGGGAVAVRDGCGSRKKTGEARSIGD